MKKRIISALAAFMLICSTVTCYAAEARASRYFDGYLLGIYAEGNAQMSVSFSVFGTGTMDQIGAYSIRVEEQLSQNNWITSFTAYGDDDPDTFYTYDFCDHTGEFTFYGTPGITYRAVLVAYAENKNGSEYSKEIYCTGKVCK